MKNNNLKLPSFLSTDSTHKIGNVELAELLNRVKSARVVDGKIFIGDQELSDYLANQLGYESDDHSIKNLVKAAILRAAGKNGAPQALPDTTSLSDLLTTDAQFVLLASYLDSIVKHFNAKGAVVLKEVTGCTTAQDTIDLVNGKINP
ncbi:MAG: hypothetical protein ACTHK0_19145 [Ginsengibacter sp.]